MSEENVDQKGFLKEWLDRLQQESWQLELLISGLALFGIWESQSLIRAFKYYIEVNVTSTFLIYANIFTIVLWIGWSIFLINLLIHIIIRGLWIGAIGLRYVSGDINFEELNYSERFIKHFRKSFGSFDEYIERLEKLSSVIFSFTFLLFFMFLSLVSFNIFFAVSANLMYKIIALAGSPNTFFIAFYGMIYYGMGLLVFIDFISLGLFKKIKDDSFSRVYLWIYRFYSTVSLSFFYRPLLLNFIDNRYTRRLFYLSIPYTLVIIMGLGNSYINRHSFLPLFDHNQDWQQVISEHSINWNFYDDQRNDITNWNMASGSAEAKSPIFYASISSYEQRETHLKLFLNYHRDDDLLISQRHPELTGFTKRGLQNEMIPKNSLKDPGYQKIVDEESDQIVSLMNNFKKYKSSDGSTQDSTPWNVEDGDVATLRNRIQDEYRLVKLKYMNDKFAAIKEAILDNYVIKIDSTDIKSLIESAFYIHPNMKERGLQCYIPLDSISTGKHVLRIIKTSYRENCTSDCPHRIISIPFRKMLNQSL